MSVKVHLDPVSQDTLLYKVSLNSMLWNIQQLKTKACITEPTKHERAVPNTRFIVQRKVLHCTLRPAFSISLLSLKQIQLHIKT